MRLSGQEFRVRRALHSSVSDTYISKRNARTMPWKAISAAFQSVFMFYYILNTYR